LKLTLSSPHVFGAVEGLVDEAVLRRLLDDFHLQPAPVYGKQGKGYLRREIAAFNYAARQDDWVVLVDLNQEAPCAPALKAGWLAQPAPRMWLCVVVREVEAWLLADRERLAGCLGVSLSQVPARPDEEPDPKQTMVNLARRSRRRAVREDMVPRPASGRAVGPAYTSRLIEFAADRSGGWRPDVAAKRSPSLRRCLVRLRRIAAQSR
jgi:hypothetical protein